MGQTSLTCIGRQLTWLSLLSILFFVMMGNSVAAHELRPAIADVEVNQEAVTIRVELALEALVAEIDVSEIDDTDQSPNAARYDELRGFTPPEIEAALRAAWPTLAGNFLIRSGNAALLADIAAVDVPDVGDIDLIRDSTLTLTAALPKDGSAVAVGWTANNGPLVIRQIGAGDDAYSALLDGGQLSEPLPRQGFATEDAWSVFLRFIVEGIEHIIPKGADHIVFVLGLFFFSLAVRPLLIQVTSFTLAHTVTLALASLGIVAIPSSVVEPLIAASIVFVAVENIVRPKLGPWRTAVVFVFGLLHGLGFASVLGELGGGQASFLARLIGFNIGVEIGQLAVILAAFVLVGLPFGKQPWYRTAIAVPASLIIAMIGVHWFADRVFDAGFLPYL